jgi:predicted anti-sigma-YlaC factor YlaD
MRADRFMKERPCDQEALSRFYDEEVEPGEYARIKEHVESCPICRKGLREKMILSHCLGNRLKEALQHVHFERVEENVLSLIRRGTIPWWTRLGSCLISKRFVVPATATIALIIFIFFLFGRPISMAGPSAIVSSLESDVASVMILETPGSRQTIVWIVEDFTSNGNGSGNG